MVRTGERPEDVAVGGEPITADECRQLCNWLRAQLDEYDKAMARDKAHRSELASIGALLAMVRVVKLLGLAYADRPGYRDEWRPQVRHG